MRLYLTADSSTKIGYTPDFLKISYLEGSDCMELTLDIRGEIDYKIDSLSCRCKGYLIPWVLRNCYTDTEQDLYELSEEEALSMFPEEKIADILSNGFNFEVGVYPHDTSSAGCNLAKEDQLSNCMGSVELCLGDNTFFKKEFFFSAELNL